MKRKVRFISIFFFTAMCMVIAGCQNISIDNRKSAQEEVWEENILPQDEMLIAVNADRQVSQLPFESVWMNRSKFWGSVLFQGLLIAKDNISNVNPDLCEEYIISADGLKYTFILKENLTWHDGEPLTVEDVVFSIETYLKIRETNGYVKKGLQGIYGAEEFENNQTEHIRGIEIQGNDITITLNKDDSGFLGAIGQLAILPKHCLEDIPVEEFSSCEFWKYPIGSGPYKLKEIVNDKEAVLVVNHNYSGEIPSIKQIRYKVLEPSKNEEFDFTITSDPEMINKYYQDGRFEVVKTNNLYYRYLMFNLDKRTGENEFVLQEPAVRKALMLGIDKERIIQRIYKGTAITIDGGIPKDDSWYAVKSKEDVEYNPQLAKQMLKEANFDFNKTLILTYYSMDELSKKLVEEIADCFRKLGIKVEIIPVESDSTNKLFVDADWYDIALKNLASIDYTEWYYEYSDDNQLWSEILHNRKEFDALIKSIQYSSYANELKMLYSQIQKLENDVVYKIPLAIVPQYVIYNKEHIYIPEMEFPNLWFYYDLDIADWSVIK